MRLKSLQIFAIVICTVGCARQNQQNANAAPTEGGGDATMLANASTGPVEKSKTNDAPGGTFTHAPSAITLSWPAGWEQKQSDKYEWMIAPAGAKDGTAQDERWISLDVPDLPIHVAGLIPIGRVTSGYIDDLKKKHGGDTDIKEQTPPTVPDCKARLVHATWKENGATVQQTALLMVHTDHVYILRSRSIVDQEQANREVFDKVAGSIKWKK